MNNQEENFFCSNVEDVGTVFWKTELAEKNKKLLSNSLGHTYSSNKLAKANTLWKCTTAKCLASVIQSGETFSLGPLEHTHTGDGALVAQFPEVVKNADHNTYILVKNEENSEDVESFVNDKIEWKLFKNASTKGHDLLINSSDYVYNLSRMKDSNSTFWRCKVRNQSKECRASILFCRHGDKAIITEIRGHSHDADVGTFKAEHIRTRIRKEIMKRPKEDAKVIVEEVLDKALDLEEGCTGLTSIKTLVRRYRNLQKKLGFNPETESPKDRSTRAALSATKWNISDLENDDDECINALYKVEHSEEECFVDVKPTLEYDIETEDSVKEGSNESIRLSRKRKNSDVKKVKCKKTIKPKVDYESEDSYFDKDGIEWKVLKNGTKSQHDLLINSADYSYTKHVTRKKDGAQIWRCTLRNKDKMCYAKVTQIENRFIPGNTEHCHISVMGTFAAEQIKHSIWKAAKDRPFDSHIEIVDEILEEFLEDDEVCDTLPSKMWLRKKAKHVQLAARKDGAEPNEKAETDIADITDHQYHKAFILEQVDSPPDITLEQVDSPPDIYDDPSSSPVQFLPSKIYTKTGDKGTSATFTGERRNKDDMIFEALGSTDELSCQIGMAREFCVDSDLPLVDDLQSIQCVLQDVGSCVATPNSSARDVHKQKTFFSTKHVTDLEYLIDKYTADLPPLKNFILPSGGKSATSLHVARAVCRRAERSVVPLVREGEIDSEPVKYLNRLSDYLFTAARLAAQLEGKEEVIYRRIHPEDEGQKT